MLRFKARLRSFFPPISAYSTSLKASAFTGKPEFYETLYLLDDILVKIEQSGVDDLPAVADSTFGWLNREHLQHKLGFPLSLLQYRQLRQRLARIAPAATISPNVMEFLRIFISNQETPEITIADPSKAPTSLSSSTAYFDEMNRAVAIGRRKSSTAKITMVPGDGQFLVNGVELHEYFNRPRDLYAIAEPFRIARQFGHFNVWALTRGGGHSGQAGAIKLATAKALCLFLPDKQNQLADCATRDPRRVERKKPGQEKARKKFTWVKR